MRRALAAAAVLAFALSPALAGCTDDDGQPPTPTDSSPPPSGDTTTPESTTTDTADAPPVLPDAAKAQTTAGAKAFVRYYADVLNYAYSHLEAEPLENLAAKSCSVCRLLAKSIRGMASNGGSQTGGEWRVVRVSPTTPAGSPTIVVAKVRIEPGSIRKTEGSKPTPIQAQTVFDEFVLSWSGRWKVKDVSPSP